MKRHHRLFQLPKIYDFQVKLLKIINMVKIEDIDFHIKGKKVLDVGCGPNSFFFSPDKTNFCVGMDISEKFVRFAQKGNTNRQRFIIGDAGNMPFKCGSFQVVVMLFTIHHIALDHKMILEEAVRCCTEKIIIVDHLQDESGFRRIIKSLWWKIKDKGYKYNTYDEWKKLFEPYHVTKEIITGGPLKNIYQVIISLNK